MKMLLNIRHILWLICIYQTTTGPGKLFIYLFLHLFKLFIYLFLHLLYFKSIYLVKKVWTLDLFMQDWRLHVINE